MRGGGQVSEGHVLRTARASRAHAKRSRYALCTLLYPKSGLSSTSVTVFLVYRPVGWTGMPPGLSITMNRPCGSSQMTWIGWIETGGSWRWTVFLSDEQERGSCQSASRGGCGAEGGGGETDWRASPLRMMVVGVATSPLRVVTPASSACRYSKEGRAKVSAWSGRAIGTASGRTHVVLDGPGAAERDDGRQSDGYSRQARRDRARAHLSRNSVLTTSSCRRGCSQAAIVSESSLVQPTAAGRASCWGVAGRTSSRPSQRPLAYVLYG